MIRCVDCSTICVCIVKKVNSERTSSGTIQNSESTLTLFSDETNPNKNIEECSVGVMC